MCFACQLMMIMKSSETNDLHPSLDVYGRRLLLFDIENMLVYNLSWVNKSHQAI